MSKIKGLKAREILDSRGNPTIEVELETDNGKFIDSVPSGASVGKSEAVELKDGGKRYEGKGVLKAIEHIEKRIFPVIKEFSPERQSEIDEKMIALDGTSKKENLGANAIMAVSLSVCRAGAEIKGLPLFEYISLLSGSGLKMPSPCFNVINGGKHAGGNLSFQEFMINFQGLPFDEQIRAGSEVYHELKGIIGDKYGKNSCNLGDEGGFSPPLISPKEALSLIMEAARSLGYDGNLNIFLDPAASEFYDSKTRTYFFEGKSHTKEELIGYYADLCAEYPIISIEDPLEQNDFEGFNILRKKLGADILIIGDDLTVSNVNLIEKAYEKNALNGLLLKINQVGTVSEAIEAANLAKSYGWKVMVSHRSGETTDDFIADFAVGIGADYIKSGAPARGERVVKYNRLLKINTLLK